MEEKHKIKMGSVFPLSPANGRATKGSNRAWKSQSKHMKNGNRQRKLIISCRTEQDFQDKQYAYKWKQQKEKKVSREHSFFLKC